MILIKMKFLLFAFLAFLFFDSCTSSKNETHKEIEYIQVNTIIDLLNELNTAQITAPNPRFVSPYLESIQDENKWAIYQHSNSTIRFDHLYIGDDAVMDFFIAMRQDSWKEEGDGVRFVIEAETIIRDVTNIIQLFDKYIDPKNNQEDRKWFHEQIPLDQVSNQYISLIMKTLPGKKGREKVNSFADWAVWGTPIIHSKPQKVEHRIHEKTNIILITVDTLREDYLHCYGNEWIQTDNIDSLAENGILFENSYSTTYTTNPSHASILTSLYPFEHGVVGNDFNLAGSIPRLQQIFGEEGYETGAIVSVYHLDKEMTGIGKWFDYFDGINKKWSKEGFKSFYTQSRSAASATNAAIDWLEKVHNKPFFLWLHYYDPHAPYLAVDGFHKKYYEGDPRSEKHTSMDFVLLNEGWQQDWLKWITPYRDLDYFKKEYAAEISYLDTHIGRFLDVMERMKLDQNTIIVLTADHGESFGEHGVYFDHLTNYNTDIRVPLILSSPLINHTGKRIKTPVSGIDLAPTILDLVGLQENYLAKKMFEGRSLRPLWEEDEKNWKRILVSEGVYHKDITGWNGQYTVYWELYNTQIHEKYKQYTDRVWIFDIINDPDEKNPIGCFYWNKETTTAGQQDEKIIQFEREDTQDVKIRKQIILSMENAGKKYLPTVDEFKRWFQDDREDVFIKKEMLSKDRFFEDIIEILTVLKKRASPPPIREKLKTLFDVSSLEDTDVQSFMISDPQFQEALQGQGYTQPDH